jgi:hypothetical protein
MRLAVQFSASKHYPGLSRLTLSTLQISARMIVCFGFARSLPGATDVNQQSGKVTARLEDGRRAKFAIPPAMITD